MATWPADLPQVPLAAGYSEALTSQVVRSQMSSGPPKTRRRTTAATRRIPVAYHLTLDQVAAFEAWFDTEIGAGALPFDWPHYRTGELASVLIDGDPPYELTPVGAGALIWRLSLTLDVQP